MLDEDRGAFRDETETRQAVVGALPPGDKVLDVGDLLGEIPRMARIAGQPALDFLPDDLPKAEHGRWCRNAPQQLLACGGAESVEAAGRSSAQHLDRGEIGGKLHIVSCEMGQNRKYQMRKPVLEQEAVPQAFEQMIIEMLVRVDEARNDDHPARIERAS